MYSQWAIKIGAGGISKGLELKVQPICNFRCLVGLDLVNLLILKQQHTEVKLFNSTKNNNNRYNNGISQVKTQKLYLIGQNKN